MLVQKPYRACRLPLMLAIVIASLAADVRQSPAADGLVQLEEQAIRRAVDAAMPSIVRIETVGGLEVVGEMLVGTGPTTGLVVSPEGLILSSAFNFAQKPASILVTLADGTRLPARLVATDHSRMLVLLEVKPEKPLVPASAAPASGMRVGQWAIAVGRTFDADKPNVSVGIVSALDRIWGRAVQTDAKISPANYGGPLIDIAGRVLGVLVPLAPDAASEVAGVEWYDSGIGFAVPLEQLQRVVPKLAAGTDLYSGVLGINLKGADMFSQPAVIAAARANSPAYKAGLQAGDTVVEINGKPVTRQAQLKQELNRHYAGDTVHLVITRADQRLERDIELIDKLEPYEYPFLGILAERPVAGKPEGLVVRFVYPDGPAANTGLQVGDQITSLAESEIKDPAAAIEKLRTLPPGDKVPVAVQRDGKPVKLELTLGRLPEAVPATLPAAHRVVEKPAAPPAGEAKLPDVGEVQIKLPEFKNDCLAYVPTGYNLELTYGVVIWLHAPGGYKHDELLARWKQRCDEHDLILLAPKSADPTKWEPSEAKFVRRAFDDLAKTYKVDPARVVVHGQDAGAALAYIMALTNLDVIRGAAPVGAALPLLVPPPETDPVHRLAFYVAAVGKGPAATLSEAGVKKLQKLKYPVTQKNLGEQPRYLNDDELNELVRWIDTLDRL